MIVNQIINYIYKKKTKLIYQLFSKKKLVNSLKNFFFYQQRNGLWINKAKYLGARIFDYW